MKLDYETKAFFNHTQLILGEIAILIKPISKNLILILNKIKIKYFS
jgi:hypothetical protein